MPQIVTVSGQQIDLLPGSEYVFGRDASCDVVVEDCSCSRRHARISVDDDGKVLIEDLDSRNGTFVNGRRIEAPTPAGDGDQIRAGTTILVVSYEPAEEPSPETREYSGDTLFLEAEEGSGAARVPIEDLTSSGIGGHLSSVSLIEVLQMLTHMGRSGTLYLDFRDSGASVEIRSGKILAAAYGEDVGLAALHAVAPRHDGRFRFVETDDDCETNIDFPTHNLLLELCRVIDESTAVEDDDGTTLQEEEIDMTRDVETTG